MPYNPDIPLDDSLLIADEMRSQFSGIVDLVNGLLPSVTAQVDDTTTLPAGDLAQATAFFAGTTMHFTFAIPQGQDGQVGQEGPQGATGGEGPQGPPFANAVADGVTTLPPSDAATVGVSFDGTNVHFSFGIPQGHDGQVGQEGPQGQPGGEGPQGQTGGEGPQGPPFANAVVDGVTTLPPSDPATVDVSFDGTNVHFSFGIPQGAPGEQGAPGDVNTPQMDAAIADAVSTTASNPSGIGQYTGAFSDPPTQGEMQDFAAYVESLRVALVRGTQATRALKPAQTRTRSTARKKRRPVARRIRQ